MTPIPITIITGFLGAGKTTIILNLVRQLQAVSSDYRIALLKNEFGDVAVDSQLASASAIAGVQELLGGCICCNLVGSLENALAELTGGSNPDSGASSSTQAPDRIIIETSGSAFPATLALEVNRLAESTGGRYALDGVISVIDVENWKGYDDVSYTARAQARYTDLIVYNKWESCSALRLDECRDRVGDLDADAAWVTSRMGWVDQNVVFGVDGKLARLVEHPNGLDGHSHNHDKHEHSHNHQSEVDVLSVTLHTVEPGATVALDGLEKLLKTAPRDEVYRIKGVMNVSTIPLDSDIDIDIEENHKNNNNNNNNNNNDSPARVVLNWSFGRWKFTRLSEQANEDASSQGAVLRATIVCARSAGNKWRKKLLANGLLDVSSGAGELTVTKL